MKEQHKEVIVDSKMALLVFVGALGIAYGLGYRNAIVECTSITKAFIAGYESCSKCRG